MPVQIYGIDFPNDFPVQPYDAVHAKVHSVPRHADQIFHLGGGWKGLAYRFLSAAEADDRFTALVGAQQSHLNRFHQDEALFNFFVNSLSTIDCLFYGLHWIGTMAEPARFSASVADNDLRRIKTDDVMSKFRTGPHGGIFAPAFAALQTHNPATGQWINTAEYEELKDVRNVLAHRASYGRIINATLGGQPPLDDVWRVRNIPINNQVTHSRRTWLAAALSSLLNSTEAYVTATL